MTQKTLITGGAGFIGLHLAKRLLDKGHQVHLVDNFSRAVEDTDLELILKKSESSFSTIDLLDLDSILTIGNDFDSIFHLGAIIGVSHVLENPYKVLYDNIRMLANVITLAHQQSELKRLFFASTSEVYAGTLENFDMAIPTPESTPLSLTKLSHPRTSYMLSKIYGEALCHQSDLPFTIFRPHNIYGPRMGMSHVIPEQLKKAYHASEGDLIEVFSPDHTRCFCFIDDAVEMLLLMMSHEECANKTLNLGADNPEVTIEELAKVCFSVVDKGLTIDPKPSSIGSPSRRQPDMSLTYQLTGYQSETGLENGIRKTFDWYKKNIFEGNSVSAK